MRFGDSDDGDGGDSAGSGAAAAGFGRARVTLFRGVVDFGVRDFAGLGFVTSDSAGYAQVQ